MTAQRYTDPAALEAFEAMQADRARATLRRNLQQWVRDQIARGFPAGQALDVIVQEAEAIAQDRAEWPAQCEVSGLAGRLPQRANIALTGQHTRANT